MLRILHIALIIVISMLLWAFPYGILLGAALQAVVRAVFTLRHGRLGPMMQSA